MDLKSSEAVIFSVINAIFIIAIVSGFIVHLVGASHRNREFTGSNPVEVLNFSGFSMHLQKLHL